MSLDVTTLSADARREAAKAVLTRMGLAWNANDPLALSNLFADKADLITVNGAHVATQAKIREAYETAFGGAWAGSSTAFRLLKLKPLGDEAIIAFLGLQLTLAGEAPRTIPCRVTLVLRMIDGEWRISLMQSTRVDGPLQAKAEAQAKQASAGSGGAKAPKPSEP